jgi:class 3 adenylate cyclase
VTLLFADIEGSTQLAYQLGEEYGPLLDEYRALLRRAVSDGGAEIDCRADEFFAAFRSVPDAFAAALAAQRALRGRAWPVSRPVPVRVRIGLHTGEPIVWAGAYLGLDVHVAVRVCAAGHGGQILVSQSTMNLLGGRAQTRDLGLYQLAGVPWPERLFQLLAPELRVDFPPLRAASAERRRGIALPRRAPRVATAAEVGRRIQALLPDAEPDLRGALIALGAVLFVADRRLTAADDLLERVDQRALARRRAATRTPRPDGPRWLWVQFEALEMQAACLNTLGNYRQDLGQCTGELLPKLPALRGVESVQRLHAQISALTDQLDEGFAQAVRVLDPLSFKRRRTRYRGVFRSGSRYVVPFYDDSGIEQQRTFESAQAARDFRFLVQLTDKKQTEYAGPSINHGHVYGGGPEA